MRHRLAASILCSALFAPECKGFVPECSRQRASLTFQAYQEGTQEIGFDPSEIESPEDVPDDVPKDVSTEKLVATMNKAKTLYEILDAPRNSTRSELKRQYVKLAKLSHPDAQIGKEQTTGENLDFSEIAAAWRVLGDRVTRKRYDRDLRAKEFGERAQQYANERLEEAVPAVAEMLDKVAIPFLRRTRATTVAVGKAVSKGVSRFSESNSSGSGNPKDLTDAFINAIEAGQQAGRMIDSLELSEKSDELAQRAEKEKKRADQIEEELQSVTQQRLFATLRSSNFALSSEEAKEVLDQLDIDDKVSIVDRAMLKTTIENDIKQLEEAEITFSEKLEQYEATDREWNELLREQEDAKQEVNIRKREEIEARKALEHAQRMVVEAKQQLVTTSNALRGVEQRVRKNANEMDRVTSALSRKQERVRNVLKNKAEMVNGGIAVDYMSEEDLLALRKKEMQLMGESKSVADMVARLQSRADKLKSRADALEKYQNGQRDIGMNAMNSA